MTWVVAIVAATTAAFGVTGGIGGAVLMVPILVFLGVPPLQAGPLGLLMVVAGSVAAAPRQLEARLVNHRLGITVELAAGSGAVAGALASVALSEQVVIWMLALAALIAAGLGGRSRPLRNPPVPGLTADAVGERIGALAGAYPLDGGVAPYRVRRLPLGLGLMTVAGFLAGATGTSGGFLKSPVMSEVMTVPVKVAAATTTFTVGLTGVAALGVAIAQGRLVFPDASAVLVGSLVGGWLGAHFQTRLSPALVRRVLAGLLVVVAVALVATR